MDASVYMTIYWAGAIIGCGYLVFSAVTGHLGGLFDHDVGGAEHDVHVDVGHGTEAVGDGGHVEGAAHAESDSGGAYAFTVASPAIISAFIGMAGICGLILSQAGVGGPLSLLVSCAVGMALAASALFGLNGLLERVQGSSHIRLADAANLEAEVITSVPEHGVGEIAFTAKGSRRTGPARAVDGAPIPRGARVVIVHYQDGCFHVQPTIDERLRLLERTGQPGMSGEEGDATTGSDGCASLADNGE